MNNINDNKSIKYFYNDKQYPLDPLNSINHTNINNNINITNYYPSPTQNYCNKQTFTFIDENGIIQNAISYPIKITTHKTKKIKDSSHTPTNHDKKYHQYQSPYIKKILPSSKREKSEEYNRIKIYKNSSSTKYLKVDNKNSLNKNSYKKNISIKNSENKNKNKKNIRNNDYYLDISTYEINNKFKRIENCNTNCNYNSEIKEIKNINYKTNTKPLLKKNNKLIIYNETNGNESQFNNFKKPYQITKDNNIHKYKNTSSNKNNNYKYDSFSPKTIKSQKTIKNNYNKDISLEKKIMNYIILIQSVIRGNLLRIKLYQYLNLYDRIKKGVSFIQYIIFQKMRYILFIIKNNNIIKKYSYLSPVNNLSLEFKKTPFKNNKIFKNESFNINNNNKKEIAEMQKELNKKKIDFVIAEKKIKELLIENKKIQNINNIIVRDNKQLALKLKNSLNNCFSNLKIENNNFNIISLYNKNEIKSKIKNLLRKIINKKEIIIKGIIYKYFYKFNFKTKLIYIKEINEIKNKQNIIIQNNNFTINKNIIEKNIIKRNNKLKYIINKKNNNLYMYRNLFEKWMMRSLIFKSKEYVKEKKKKKKEKFKQKKQKRLYGYYLDKNDKKNNEDKESSGDEDFLDEPKYNNKFNSNKQNNNYYENYKK